MEKHFKICRDLSKEYKGRTLYRIEATKDIPERNIQKGVLGGWIEKEENLQGNAWIADEAKVYGNAIVHGNAIVYNGAEIGENAEVYGNALVSGNAKVYGCAQVFNNANVYGDAKVYGNARVYGNAIVLGDILQHENDCKNIVGEKYNITITPNYIKIGCQHHTKEEWWNFTDREILEMDGKEGLKWWKNWKPILQLICKTKQPQKVKPFNFSFNY